MPVVSTLRSIPRAGWYVTGFVVIALVSDPIFNRCQRWWSRRKARRHTEAIISDVFFANERSNRADDEAVPMDRFTSEHVRRIVDYLDRARVSVDLAMYIVTVDQIGKALIRAKNRGVRVRVIGCTSMTYSSGSQMIKLAEEDIPIRSNEKNGAYLMHHKFCLIDTDWLCPGCYHAERVRRLGFCCDEAPERNGNQLQLPNGHAMAANGDGGFVANGGGRAKVYSCDLTKRSGCARCQKKLREEKERVLLEEGERDPLPLGGVLMSGSTNWTMQALSGNWDNMIVTSLPDIVMPFQAEFQRLWACFARSPPVEARAAEDGQ